MTEAITVPLIAGVVQVLKVSGVPKRLLPLSSLIIGVGVGLAAGVSLQNAIAGATFGLSAVGLYEGYKSVAA